MKKFLYIILCLCALLSCTERREYREAVERAQEVIEEHPDSALAILDTLGTHSGEFGHRFGMQYQLWRTYAEAKTGVLFTTDSLTRILVDYFEEHGRGNESCLAYYMHGCALIDIGRAPEALQAYYDAIDRADTTNNMDAYRILRGVYGQMASIFHKQNLPKEEIEAREHYIDCVRKTSSKADYIIAKSQLLRPYSILDNKEMVLQIIKESYHELEELGLHSEAASMVAPSIFIYTSRNQMSEAEKMLNLFEHDSGEFDSLGNISKGREAYYYTRGMYCIAIKDIDSAEHYFRKSIQYGHLSEGYRGLLHVYRERGDMDSIVHFSVMYEAAQDSLHDQMRTDAIHQMASLYNYTRSEKEAELAREQARKNRTLFVGAIFAAMMIIGSLCWIFKEVSRKKKWKIANLERDLSLALDTRNKIQEELRQLKSQDYESVIAAKESRLAELYETIEQLQAENESYIAGTKVSETDNPNCFLNSEIANLFIRKSKDINVKIQPIEKEWNQLVTRFRTDNPVTYKKFRTGRALSMLEMRICILLILDISESAISLITDKSASVVSNSKARANEKLFGKKEATTLKSNLLQLLYIFSE